MTNANTQLGNIEQATAPRRIWREYRVLAKWRLNAMVLLTTLIGYLLAGGGIIEFPVLIHAMIGAALAAAGAGAINQYLERDIDHLMKRTQGRPLVTGTLTEYQVLQFGTLCTCVGVLQLALFVNLLAAFLCTLTAACYLFAYTPLKTRTPANTLIGAIPGALPPVIGWAAATNELSTGSWVLFAIMFMWQLPHFFAIAWIYREDYRRAGMVMLSGLDEDGGATARHMVMCTLTLIFISWLPVVTHLATARYFVVASFLGACFLTLCLRFWFKRTAPRARAVMLGSLAYLPALLTTWLIDAL